MIKEGSIGCCGWIEGVILFFVNSLYVVLEPYSFYFYFFLFNKCDLEFMGYI